ncbi:MAG: hypothetical protein K1X83_07495 [Oligoflexia bacterium]|nr:hypothetical protein [Oligoflexia bacterium]
MSVSTTASTSLINDLKRVRARFDPLSLRKKEQLMRRLPEVWTLDLSTCAVYVDFLLFLRAYPHSALCLSEADDELLRICGIAEHYAAAPDQLGALGLPGGTREECFSFDLTAWLVAAMDPMAEISFDQGEIGESFDELLQQMLLGVESDAVLSGLSAERLCKLVRGDSFETTLKWLLSRLRDLGLPHPARDQLFRQLSLAMRWEIPERLCRPRLRFPERDPYLFGNASTRHTPSLEQLKLPVGAALRMTADQRRALLNTARATLAVRGRETDTITYASLADLQLYQLERGIDVATFGLAPEHRLPIESYIGFMVAQNSIPVGYGGAWILGRQSEIGINIFDEFRGGDSSSIFLAVLQVFTGRYGVESFAVHPNQFGADNEDGLASGAFWFYYRIGFRSASKAVNALAAQELARRQVDVSYRSSRAVLKKLLKDQLLLDLRAPAHRKSVQLDVRAIGAAVAEQAGSQSLQRAVAQVPKWLKCGSTKNWPISEQRSFAKLCPLVACIKDLSHWSTAEKSALTAIMRAKGGACESRYVGRIQDHPRYLAALEQLAARGGQLTKDLSTNE